ncbi:MAG: FecR family protein [Candidatus Acidiferrales bacterium]
MNARHPFSAVVAILVCLLLAVPVGVSAQVAQSAGKITAVVPIVNVVRGAQQVAASTSQQVFWGDVINTGHLARARVALDDGSILSVGSDSNLTIAKHDTGEQQTDLDLAYGQVRARAVKLVKPNARFQIRTPVGVAGVVGTEMVVLFDAAGNMQVVCMEGACKVCDLSGFCVLMKGGEETGIHGNSSPSAPAPVSPATLTAAVSATNTAGAGAGAGAAGAGAAGGGIGAGTATAVGVGGAVAAGVATAVVRSVSKTQTCPPPTSGGARPRAECTQITTGARVNGQRQ